MKRAGRPDDPDGFEEFWSTFPRHVGRIAAVKAYKKAIESGVEQQAILDGVARYIKMKPSYADWCHPRTWLSQGRWLDEPDTMPAWDDTPITASELQHARRVLNIRFGDCSHTPQCANQAACLRAIVLEVRAKVGAA